MTGTIEAFRSSLMLGTARRPPAIPPEFAALAGTVDRLLLGSIALAAQHGRLSRTGPVVPLPAAAEQRADAFVPAAARNAVQELLRSSEPATVRATLLYLRRKKRRLHPFDLALVGPAAGKHPRLLDPADRDALGIAEPEADLTLLPPKRVEAALLEERRRDPDGARVRLEAAFKQLNPTARAGAILALAERLGPGDRSFLEDAAKDRSKTVRAEAEALLGRFSGTEANRARVARLAEDCELKRSPIFGLQVRIEKGAPSVAAAAGLPLGDLLEAVGLDRDRYLAAAPALPAPLDAVFMAAAIRADDDQLVRALVKNDPVDWFCVLESDNTLDPAHLERHLPAIPVARQKQRIAPLIGLLEARFEGLWPEDVGEAFAAVVGPNQLPGRAVQLLGERAIERLIPSLPPGHPLLEDPWVVLVLALLAADRSLP